jgi:CHC2 zinc finger
MGQWIDFKEVKAMASMADVLAHYGVRFQHKTQIYLPCPLPSHTSKHSSNSLSVNLERNIWACKSESCISGRNGKEGGNVLDFVMWMERCDLKSAAAKIVEWFGTKQNAPSPERSAISGTPDNPNPPAEEHNLVDWLERKTPDALWANPGVRADNPSPPDHNSSAGNGNSNPKGYMKDVDVWFESLITDPPDWKKIKTAFKARLIESYKNGAASKF